MVSTVVIANPVAGAGRFGRAWHKWHGPLADILGELDVRHTEGPGDATRLVRHALRSGVRRVAVAGGDGSLNEAVNGFFDEMGTPIAPDAELVPLPLGTGGDFARAVGLSGVDVPTAIRSATPRSIDVGRVELTAPTGDRLVRHFLNISSFGVSGLIVDLVNRTSKRFGARASFLAGTLRGLWQFENQPVRLTLDGRVLEERVMVVAVANGRYFGGAMKIAPAARLDDGTLDVTVVGDLGLLDFVRYSPRLYRGTHIGVPGITGHRAQSVVAEPLGREPVLVDLDGEQPGKLPARYDLLPKALLLRAPWERAEVG